jgi:hypothetical protein
MGNHAHQGEQEDPFTPGLKNTDAEIHATAVRSPLTSLLPAGGKRLIRDCRGGYRSNR